MTLSRVVVFPTKVMRLTKYCFPSCTRIVTSMVGGPGGFGARACSSADAGSRGLMSGYAVNS